MPQRQFWTEQHPTGVSWRYHTNPCLPESKPTLLVNVYDQAYGSMDSAEALVPLNVLHECVADLLVASWEAYLFGEPGDVRPTFKARLKTWQTESSSRPLWA